MEIGMAHTSVLDVDKNLIWARLRYWNLLVHGRTSDLLDDLGPLHLGNIRAGAVAAIGTAGRHDVELWNGSL